MACTCKNSTCYLCFFMQPREISTRDRASKTSKFRNGILHNIGSVVRKCELLIFIIFCVVEWIFRLHRLFNPYGIYLTIINGRRLGNEKNISSVWLSPNLLLLVAYLASGLSEIYGTQGVQPTTPYKEPEESPYKLHTYKPSDREVLVCSLCTQSRHHHLVRRSCQSNDP